MKKLPSTRILISIALVLLFLVFLVAVLFVTNLSFSVWEQLQQKPDWVIWAYLSVIILFTIIFGRIIWRLLVPKKKRAEKKQKSITSPENIDAVEQRLETMLAQTEEHSTENSLSEVAAIKAELQEYARRKEQQTLYIALFGDISSGKSSLIKALIGADNDLSEQQLIESSVIGGTTREIHHYFWRIADNETDQQYILTDMPGLNEQFAELDILAANEVQRAHITIYLCDGDLTASQFKELESVLLLGKPCIVAVNKSDRYSKEDLQLIISQIQQRIETIREEKKLPGIPVVTISAGGMREFLRMTSDGEEERVQRPLPPDVKALREELQRMMRQYGTDQLERLREKSVAGMVNNRLDDLDAQFRQSKSRRMVNGYTKKAIVAALATVSPGTDILVQGYLGIQLIKDLCKLYDVPATDIDANKLIELIQSRTGKALPLLLAIAGNGFKAFPGVGTITGGLMHAVAYGMIFDTLGRSVARTLEVTGELSPALISDLYKEQLSENIDSRTKDFIKLVLQLRKEE